jgi:hypothetical protein
VATARDLQPKRGRMPHLHTVRGTKDLGLMLWLFTCAGILGTMKAEATGRSARTREVAFMLARTGGLRGAGRGLRQDP